MVTPDVAVGAGMVATGVAAYAVNYLVCGWALTPQEVEVDHTTCDGCGRTICRDTTPCAETVAQGCGHGRSLCTGCAPGECDECLIDLRCQGVLSQYVIGTFPTPSGGAA